MQQEGGLAGVLQHLAGCAPLLSPQVGADVALVDEVRALVVEAARLRRTPAGGSSPWGQQQHPDARAPSAAQRLRLVINAAAEVSALSRALAALEAAVALHPDAVPSILAALRNDQRCSLPGIIAAAEAAAQSRAAAAVAHQLQLPSGRPRSGLARVSSPWDAAAAAAAAEDDDDEEALVAAAVMGGVEFDAAAAAGGGQAGPAPTPGGGGGGGGALFPPRDPRAAHLAASYHHTPGDITPPRHDLHNHHQQQQAPPSGSPRDPRRRSGSRGASAAASPTIVPTPAAAALSHLTAADVLMMLTLRGKDIAQDELIATTLCEAVQGTRCAQCALSGGDGLGRLH